MKDFWYNDIKVFVFREVIEMTIVIASNYFNHHQRYLCEALDELTGHSFFFVETMEMEQERKNMGWGTGDVPPFVLRSYDPAQRGKCRALIRNADVVIWGSCPYGMILPRLLAHKLTFCYSERIFKEGRPALVTGAGW